MGEGVNLILVCIYIHACDDVREFGIDPFLRWLASSNERLRESHSKITSFPGGWIGRSVTKIAYCFFNLGNIGVLLPVDGDGGCAEAKDFVWFFTLLKIIVDLRWWQRQRGEFELFRCDCSFDCRYLQRVRDTTAVFSV